MRRLGQSLGVEAMSLYNHARNKDDILDGIVDAVIGEIGLTSPESDWRVTVHAQVMTARSVLLRHPWAPRVIESRKQPGPATMRYMESVIAVLRTSGFSVDLTHHTMHVLGSRIFGFNQELYDDGGETTITPEVAAMMAREMAGTYPYIIELTLAISHEGGLGGCDDDIEFAFGLGLILDGLERLRSAS